MATVEDWAERLRESVRFNPEGPRTRASSRSSRASRASRASSRRGASASGGPEEIDHDAANSLADAVQGIAKVAIADLQGEAGMSEADALAEVKVALTVATRKELRNYPLDKAGLLLDGVIALLESGAQLAEAELPFVLIEDLFHTENVDEFPKIWSLLEQRGTVLTSSIVMNAGIYPKMVMMRLGNFLLSRLSASHDTAFCGRVQMFLAAAVPLSDKSGVNLFGEYNENNVTKMESEEDFGAATKKAAAAVAAIDAASVIGEQKSGETAINYSLYFKFWQLQRSFTARPERQPNGCVASEANWTEFTQTADVVLSSFESKPFSEADLEREATARRASKFSEPTNKSDKPADARRKRRKITGSENGINSQQGAGDSVVDFFPIKYLTSSRLLKLQLSDPSLRRNVLVQFAFLLNSIKQLLNGSINNTSKISAPVTKLINKNNGQGMAALWNRVTSLLQATPPDGPGFLKDLLQILQRDDQWYSWKFLEKCKNFEREAVRPKESSSDAGEEEHAEVDEATKKLDMKDRMRAAKERQMQTKVKKSKSLWRCFDLGTWSQRLAEKADPTPKFGEFIKDMEVAIDPENGIEDEYHPKHDSIYCWRGFRLLSQNNLDIMSKVTDASLENATKKLIGFVDPPPVQVTEEKVEEEQEKDKGTTTTEGSAEKRALEEKKPSEEQAQSEEKKTDG